LCSDPFSFFLFFFVISLVGVSSDTNSQKIAAPLSTFFSFVEHPFYDFWLDDVSQGPVLFLKPLFFFQPKPSVAPAF